MKTIVKTNRGIRIMYGKRRKAVATCPACWPLHSDAFGVLPSQIREASENAAKAGVPTNFDSQGCAIFTDRNHMLKYYKYMGQFDRTAGYRG